VRATAPAADHFIGHAATPGRPRIALYDFGGQGRDLLLVHATGFCADVFTPLAAELSREFHCWGLDLRGHGRSDRPQDDDFAWSGFSVDVLGAIDHLGLDRPLAFGHSCGGAAILLAEQARPGTFASLFCFEPVVPAVDHPLPPDEDAPLARGARRRRERFPSAEEAFTNFSSKPPFADLDRRALSGYVQGGFETVHADEGGDGREVRLRCRRDDEAEVYAQGFSHDAFAHLGEIACPVVLACGADTDSFGLTFLEPHAERLPRATLEALPHLGHFGPLQRPEDVAASVVQAFHSPTPRFDTPGS
jgi:pimeloyl-ACP methyl ester carboxylesterase